MVGWYDPQQLGRTAIEVALSTIFGRHADYRLLEALRDGAEIHDYREGDDGRPRQEIWIDYVADVGDGWNSTYAVASLLAAPALTVSVGGGASEPLPRGRVLVFGGDQVYPIASRAEYQRRFVGPYECALPWTEPPHPDAFAIPGNHDWYDSLVAYTRLFCTRRWLGGWKTRQGCSYFALRLPHGWWLLGTDVQLASDIDEGQIAFFRHVAGQMNDGDRVVLCNAEPHWVNAAMYGRSDPDVNENNLLFLEKSILKKSVRVFLAGDLHHYRRHQCVADGTQKITCGGGGAFLHPTHGPDVRAIDEKDSTGNVRRRFTLVEESVFPPEAVSRRLTWRNLAFPLLNPWFVLVPAFLYMLTAQAAMVDLGRFGLADWWPAVTLALHGVLWSPVGLFWTVATLLGFMFFTDTHSVPYRRIGGLLHGFAHLAAVFLLGWAVGRVTTHFWEFGSVRQILASAALIFPAGGIVGAWILGVYLFVSLNVFRRHSNEAFSSLRIDGWKSFLRLHIDQRGDLTIYPIGIERVPRRWRPSGDLDPKSPLRMVPADGRATKPNLIDRPITVHK
jgi:hypothetical protein